MDSIQHWLAFTALAFFVTLTPGPAVILALSNSLTYGPARAMIGSLGNAIGLIVVAVATTAGLGALLVASSNAFLMLKIAGAGYLIYLGIKQLWSKEDAFDDPARAPRSASVRQLFIKGISVAITNPKAILFFIAFLPQFIQPGLSYTGQASVLIMTFAGCSVCAHVIYVVLAQMLKPILTAANRRKKVNSLFGASFIALGLSLFMLKGRTTS
jgi:threonine/homoserine/homoserine lactone efflux protein